MALMLTGFIIGFVVAMSASIIIEDIRFVPRHVLPSITTGLGLALILPAGYNNTTMNQLGVMLFFESAILWLRPKKKQNEKGA